MANAKQKCLMCGTEYEVCRFCPTTIKFTPWRRLCDSPRHYQVYMLLQDIRAGVLTNDEAKDRLAYMKMGIDEVKELLPSVQETLLPLLAEKSDEPVEAEVEVVEPVAQPQIKKKTRKNTAKKDANLAEYTKESE